MKTETIKITIPKDATCWYRWSGPASEEFALVEIDNLNYYIAVQHVSTDYKWVVLEDPIQIQKAFNYFVQEALQWKHTLELNKQREGTEQYLLAKPANPV